MQKTREEAEEGDPFRSCEGKRVFCLSVVGLCGSGFVGANMGNLMYAGGVFSCAR